MAGWEMKGAFGAPRSFKKAGTLSSAIRARQLRQKFCMPLCVATLPIGCPVEPYVYQAEAGIRDRTVTGVQTCALPICQGHAQPGAPQAHGPHRAGCACRPYLV